MKSAFSAEGDVLLLGSTQDAEAEEVLFDFPCFCFFYLRLFIKHAFQYAARAYRMLTMFKSRIVERSI
jgi:hypothetical protein